MARPSTSADLTSGLRSRLLNSGLRDILAPLSFLLLLSLVLWRMSPAFATSGNLKQIAVQAAVVAILACGQTAVMISGNIDLSVGAVMAFAGVAAAMAMNQHVCGVWGGVGIACGTGLVLGAITGMITGFGKIPAFIASLGMMGVVHGLGGILSHSVTIGGLPDQFSVFGFGELFGDSTRDGIPYAAMMMLAAAIVVHILLRKLAWGRSIYAIGGNLEAARLSGIRITKTVTGVFALSGLLAGFAAVVNVSRASVASKDAGIGLELDSVAAAVVGGTSLMGGVGGIPGTIIGAFLIYTIRNGCALLGYGPDHQRAIIGAVVVLAVLYDRYGPGRRLRAA